MGLEQLDERSPREGLKNIKALIVDGGKITLGDRGFIGCVATAADQHYALAMLARREGETLNALIKRLDKAIGRYDDDG
jgi:hypothetical protein